MAVDTAEKRFSMMGFGRVSTKLMTPTGSVNEAQRATALNLYSGITLDAPVVVVVVDPIGLASLIFTTEGVTSTVTTTQGISSTGETTKGVTSTFTDVAGAK